MRNSVKLAFGTLMLTATFALPAATPVVAQDEHPNVCLNEIRIVNTYPVDERTIIFKMRDGSTWRNTLASACPGLAMHSRAFSMVSHTESICAFTQRIKVLDTGEVCRLGNFERVS